MKFFLFLQLLILGSISQAESQIQCMANGNWFVEITQNPLTKQINLRNYKLVERSAHRGESHYVEVYSHSENVVMKKQGKAYLFTGKTRKLLVHPYRDVLETWNSRNQKWEKLQYDCKGVGL